MTDILLSLAIITGGIAALLEGRRVTLLRERVELIEARLNREKAIKEPAILLSAARWPADFHDDKPR